MFSTFFFLKKKSANVSRLFNEHASHTIEDVRVTSLPAEEVFIELLLSYRLIFSQHRRSAKAFSALLPANWASDPLLAMLCGTHDTDTTRSFYDELDAGEPRTNYLLADFPYFGKRLLEVQEFVRTLHPLPKLSGRSLVLGPRNGGEIQTVRSSTATLLSNETNRYSFSESASRPSYCFLLSCLVFKYGLFNEYSSYAILHDCSSTTDAQSEDPQTSCSKVGGQGEVWQGFEGEYIVEVGRRVSDVVCPKEQV